MTAPAAPDKYVRVLASDAPSIGRFITDLKRAVADSRGSTGGHTAFLALHDGRKLAIEVVIRGAQ
jgi:hypothetical protein